MGRPLNKKYFGNRNIGTGGRQITGNLSNSQNYADDRIGGEGVASYGSIVAGNGWTTSPDPYFSNPNIPGGVTVAGIVHYKALSFATTANGSGYAVGDILEADTGTASTKARAPVSGVLTVATPNITNGGSLYDVTSPTVGDTVTFTHANLTIPLRVRITAVSGSTATSIAVEQAGVWTGSGAPTSMADGVGGFTATTTAQPGGDNNGTGLVLGFTSSMWGVHSFGAPTVAGDYTLFPSTGTGGTLTSVSPATGTGATADITMGLLSVVITEKGSGYSDPADAELIFDNGANGASAVAVLTTDTGVPGSATNQENAIIINANTIDEGAAVGDIIKQVSTRRYKVKTSDGIAVCKLVADSTPGFREAFIKATDDDGNTYYVTKLTRHRAVLSRWNEENTFLFETGASVPWSFDSTANGRVIIENA